MARGSIAKNRNPETQIITMFSFSAKPAMNRPASAREIPSIRACPFRIPVIPVTSAVASMPSEHTVSVIPSVPESAKDSTRGSLSTWITPMNMLITEETRISRSTPFRARIACQPSRRLPAKLSRFSFFFVSSPFLTTAVAATVTKNVQMSITSSRRMS